MAQSCGYMVKMNKHDNDVDALAALALNHDCDGTHPPPLQLLRFIHPNRQFLRFGFGAECSEHDDEGPIQRQWLQ